MAHLKKVEISTDIAPAKLTPDAIKAISARIAQELAAEVAALGPMEEVPLGFHIRVGGEHSRSFSKTADHKNVIHSRTIVTGSGPF